ncbi:MAG: ABC transporter permease [bacterium]|nr:ABC transporter permease [bacterium]MDE0289722.1 ABC transporter permease [bacterium]MDE0440177.1 ABC transporter permease [bacterium]
MGDIIGALWEIVSSPTMYGSAVRLGAFLAFAALGELVAEKAGTINISVEASLLAGAFGGAVAFSVGGSVWVGLVLGVVAGLAVSMLQANMSHRLTADQFVVGITVNILVLGLIGFLTASIDPVAGRAGVVKVPLLSALPLIGPALFGQTWPTYLLYPIIPLTWWILYRTRWGLEVRSVGENPQAADVSGIDVNKRRRQAIYYGGVLAGLGGAFLVLGQVGSFDTGAVGGRGFIAIAAVYFGGWRLRGTILGALLFGLADAFRLAVPVLGYQINAQLLAALPYVLTLGVMYFITKRFRQPAALAQPFVRGLR